MRKLFSEILWLLILLALSLVMGFLLLSGNLLIFLAPRMIPMVWFGLCVLLLLLGFQAFTVLRLIKQKSGIHGGRIGLLLFMVPLVLFVTVMPNQSTPGSLPNQSVKMISASAQSTAIPAEPSGSNAADAEDAMEIIDPESLQPCTLENETALFDASSDLFSSYSRQSLEDLVGKMITVYGFVYRDTTFPENTMLLSRMMIVCCAADASLVGFYVKLEDGLDLEQNSWVRVTGTVQKINMEYYGDRFDFPILTNGIIVPCNAPSVDNAYVYP